MSSITNTVNFLPPESDSGIGARDEEFPFDDAGVSESIVCLALLFFATRSDLTTRTTNGERAAY